MFQLGQIVTSTQLLRNYRKVLRVLERNPQPLLITQRNGAHFVLVNAEIFEDMTLARVREEGMQVEPFSVREVVNS